MTLVKVITEGTYQNHNVKNNKAVTIILKAPYSEMRNYLLSVQLINENTDIGVKIGSDKKPLKLGNFMFHGLNIDRDGEAKLTWNSLIEHTEMNNLNELASRSEEPLKFLFKAEIEDEEVEDEE